MKTQLSAMDIHYLISELQILVGAKIDRIYHPEDTELLLIFHVPNKGKCMLKIKSPDYMHKTDQKGFVVDPSEFCLLLRKHLNNARLEKIAQVGFERIVELLFGAKQGQKKLFIELFSKGNIVLCSGDDLIICPLHIQRWSDRIIKPKEKYLHPKKDFNLLVMNEDVFKASIQNTNKESLVKSLAIDFGLGGVYAEEACLRAKVHKKTGQLQNKEAVSVFKAVTSMVTEKIEAYIVYEESKPIDVVPFDLKLYEGKDKKRFKAFNDALNEFFVHQIVKPRLGNEKQIKKIQDIISEQKKKIAELESKEKEEREIADMIYHNYKLVGDIILEMRSASDKFSWQDLQKKLKDQSVIKQVNPKEKSVMIELG